jgi:hypothetical protein
MEQYRNLNEIEEKELRRIFKKSVRLSKTVFGERAFYRFVVGSNEEPNGDWERKRNKGIFDIIMFGFTMYEENQIVPNSDSIREELFWLMGDDEYFINAISGSGTDGKEKTFTRFDKWLSSLKEIVGTPKTEPRNFSLQYKKQLWESNPTCALCEQRIHLIDDAEVDHVDQYWRGGKTIPSNARLTHRYCNRARSRSEGMLIERPVTKREVKKPRVRGATPQKEYRIPILEALLEKEGKATQDEVFGIIYQRMREDFNHLDLETLSDGYTRRWQKNAAWQRYSMVKIGLLKSGSARGIWEITDEGRKFLKDNK